MGDLISGLGNQAEGPAVGDLMVWTDVSDTTQAATGTTKKNEARYGVGAQVNAQTGTTYTYLTTDFRKLVTHSNGSAIAGTLPQAGASFPAGWFMFVQNRGAGALTITPTTSTIDGAATLVLNQNEGAIVVSDGTNYFTLRGKATGAAGVGDVVGPGSATDNALARFDSTTGKLIQTSAVTVDDTGVFSFPDNVRQTFNPGADAAGLNVGAIAGDPGTPSNGDLWYDSTANELTARINGSNVALGAGGGGGTPGGSDGDIQYRVDASTFGGSSLKRIDANSVDIVNTTNAQRFRVFKTTTDNHRLRIQNVSNKWEIAAEADATPDSLDLMVGSSRFGFTTTAFTPPSDGSQQLGSTSVRWAQFNGNNINIANGAEFRWNSLTRIQAGNDGFPLVLADAGIGSNCGWIFGRNDTNGVRLRRVSTVLETRLGGDSDYAVHVAAGFRMAERSADPSAADLTSGANAKDRAQWYMKNDKLVCAYNNSGTVTFITIPLDGSTATWTHSTSAP